ncbi:MAG TPA: hypothetical protein VNK43_01800 [Gemmatimonadales bacterium]|nr:hypothetical protein [Gemmatimonadales bacterium]
MTPASMRRATRRTLGIQAAYYAVSGLWPLLSLASFEAVTGPKVDDWLVRMVGLLAVVIGLSLARAAAAGRLLPETLLLSVGAAAAFAAIDVRYALGGRISPIYLADAVVEVAFAAVVLGTARRPHRAARG